ncbi:DUF3052 domain-containing protein [Kaistia dalseonensis]|uniref:DUF3052 domain-containing protein n=1 Tax=Kaistia dalseonensis TaxID=410840 RepID=A0ABU0H571_9HYPH|nr:DUF3052 domain-containing protein [Kaistia dalseonensis]MCX5494319.1 DUF3052 domain-containing protein [Kaistia dalseonensis]MDQ0436900.1 hypothetical protein [Kaistia dalseonensis]
MTTAPLPQSGYSGRSLPEKLGFKPGMAVAFIGLPAELTGLADCVTFKSVTRTADWAEPIGPSQSLDAIHAFTKSTAEIVTGLPLLQDAIKRDGMVWVSWPKKASKVPTDVTEDAVRNAALDLDLVDIKVAAIDAVWSGLKLMIRKDRRSQ